MKKAFLTRRLPEIASELLRTHFEVSRSEENAPFPAADIPSLVQNYDAVLSTITEKFDRAVLSRKGRLRVISNYAVGLDNIDLEAAREFGVSVYNTPDVVTEPTADLTFGLMLACERKIPSADAFVKRDRWKGWDPELFNGRSFSDKRLGIVGFGKIGRAVAKRARGFGMRVAFYDPFPIVNDDSELQRLSLDELLAGSDVISVHVPLTAQTRGMFDLNAFVKMKRHPLFINMARGPVVNTDDLLVALENKLIRGAALDVINPEPFSGAHPLCAFENVLLTPHIGTATVECRLEMAALAANNIIAHFSDNR